MVSTTRPCILLINSGIIMHLLNKCLTVYRDCACFLLPYSGNGRLASIGVIVGFIVMMSLDVGLG